MQILCYPMETGSDSLIMLCLVAKCLQPVAQILPPGKFLLVATNPLALLLCKRLGFVPLGLLHLELVGWPDGQLRHALPDRNWRPFHRALLRSLLRELASPIERCSRSV